MAIATDARKCFELGVEFRHEHGLPITDGFADPVPHIEDTYAQVSINDQIGSSSANLNVHLHFAGIHQILEEGKEPRWVVEVPRLTTVQRQRADLAYCLSSLVLDSDPSLGLPVPHDELFRAGKLLRRSYVSTNQLHMYPALHRVGMLYTADTIEAVRIDAQKGAISDDVAVYLDGRRIQRRRFYNDMRLFVRYILERNDVEFPKAS
jgi:hypothetical protein